MKKKKELLRVFQTSDRLLAILIDPDKVNFSKLENLIEHLPNPGGFIESATRHLNDNGDIRPLQVQVGDTVVFGKYSGTEIEIKGVAHLIVRESELLGMIEG